MTEVHQTISLTEADVERVLRELCHLELEEMAEANNRWQAICPFHDDHHPSMKITAAGLYHCFSCKAAGNLTQLVHHVQKTNHLKHAWYKILKHVGKETKERKATLAQVKAWHAALLERPERLQWLQEKRGLTVETIINRYLGWAKERDKGKGAYVIPIFKDNRVQLVRFYLPHLTKGKQRGQKGHNQTSPCWPTQKTTGPILIVESEFDWILVEQLGYRAFTATNGAGNIAKWVVEHLNDFRGEQIILCFDKDEAGQSASRQVAIGLSGIAQGLACVHWPGECSVGTDPTDFIVRDGHSEVEFRAAIDAAESITESIVEIWKHEIAEGQAKKHARGKHALRDLIEELHWLENTKGIRRRYDTVQPPWKLGLAVIEWFKQQGSRFFRDRQGCAYILFNQELREIGKSRELFSLLWELGGCNKETAEGRYIAEALVYHALREGQQVSSFNWLYFCRKSWSLYVNLHNDRDEILRIAPNSIDVVANGTNEDQVILNRSEYMQAIEFNPKVDIRQSLAKWKALVFDSFAVDPVARTIIAGWAWAMWLRTLSQEKPILKLSGRMESGKSAIGRFLTALIYGEDQASVSTTAANFSDAATEPLIFLDDLKIRAIDTGMEQFFKVIATGIKKKKRTMGTERKVSNERGDALVMVTAIESFPTREVQSRTYEIEAREECKTQGFNLKRRLEQLLVARHEILSGFFRLLSEHVLPALQMGDDRRYFEYFARDMHAKYRTNNFLALMLLLVDAISRFVPGLWPPAVEDSELRAPKASQLAGAWMLHQDELDAETGSESSVCLGYLNALLGQLGHTGILYHSRHMDSGDKDLLIRKAQGFGVTELAFHKNGDGRPMVVGFRLSTAEMFWAMSKVGKELGRVFPIPSPRVLGQRIANDMPLITADDWVMENAGKVKGDRKYLWVKGITDVKAISLMSLRKLQEEMPW